MKDFTKTQLKKLKKFEQHLYTSFYQLYKRPTPAALNDELADFWDAHTGGKVARNWGCGSCVYNLYRAVAKCYYETQIHIKEREEKAQTESETPKRGRPRKTE